MIIGQGVHFKFNGRIIAAIIIDIIEAVMAGESPTALLQTFDPKGEVAERVTAAPGGGHFQFVPRPSPAPIAVNVPKPTTPVNINVGSSLSTPVTGAALSSSPSIG